MQTQNLKYRSLNRLAKQLRRDLVGVHKRKASRSSSAVKAVKPKNFVLLFAHNGVGKTRLSMEFKDIGKNSVRGTDTLYFNAFTEDLFDWNNDFENDIERRLKFKSESNFFKDLEGHRVEDLIRPHLDRYFDDLEFRIDFTSAEIIFIREEIIQGRNERLEDIKISRGEENIFIWCFFLAIAQLALDAEKGDPYDWVKFIYIDDPISSLDENNAIMVASDLSRILKENINKIKVVISTHHGLFFNVLFNELKTEKNHQTGEKIEINKKIYVLQRAIDSLTYNLRDSGETPLLHHVVTLQELQSVAKSGNIRQHHFNMLRSILEKTVVFFGSKHISACFEGHPDKRIYSRFIQVRSHAKYSIFEDSSLNPSEKIIFRDILKLFLQRYPFKI